MTPEEFRAAGHQIVDWIADYRATVGSRPVMARTEPGDVRKQLPADPPDEPEPFASIVSDLDRIIVHPEIQRVAIVLEQEANDVDAILAHGEVQRLAIVVVRPGQRPIFCDERSCGFEIA